MTETKATRVLVVDDEPSILELLSTALVALGGHDVSTASSGQEALKLMGEGRPRFDLVLLDIQMPEMNGVDVCARIRSTAGYRDTPVIMLTAMSQMDYVEKAFLAGATDYVTKPFNFEDLRNRIANAFRASETKRAAAEGGELAPLVGRARSERIKFDAKLDFTEFNRFLDTDRFDNYVRQMASSRAPQTSAFAVKVSNGYYLHRALSSEEFHACMRNVALLLSEVTEKMGSLVSYRGQGIFLCVEYGNRLSDTETIETFLNSEIDTHGEKKTRPKIVVSPHAELKQNDTASACVLMNDAITKVEARDTAAAETVAGDQAPSSEMRKAVAAGPAANDTRSYRTLLSSVLRGF
ncbi:response regulator [Marimonas arenosa]|uniref:Response regulator n=1 Tax=Marimonas arenosa TaxID=1795305 RepID=A0AAE3W9E4_9RHOB|nr:response regulator [Marimonas arenosa]MDQ2088796.1 response regulator [Marimonas arenosa]